jgi:hypothetical protein
MVDSVLPNTNILTQLEPILTELLLDQNIQKAENDIISLFTTTIPGNITNQQDIMTRLSGYQQQQTQIQNVGEELDIINARIEELQFCLGQEVTDNG